MRRLFRASPIQSDLALLILRLYLGAAFAVHGWDKLDRVAKFAGSVEGMGFPAPEAFAWLAILSELVGGILLALGLFTRVALLPAAASMIVAAFVLHDGAIFGDAEHAMLYLVPFVALFLTGPGRYSVDRVVFGGR